MRGSIDTAFTLGGTFGGHRFLSATLPSNGIQNGPRDGFAIVNQTTSQVLQLLSYGGTFTAGNGPASGMTSIPIPVSQSNSTTIANSSIGLTASGWAASSGSNSKGSPNAGQTLTLVPLPQGIAFDNLNVTFLPDNDLDGIPDVLDPDDDNDTQTDFAENLFGTDPFNAGSFYQIAVSRSSPNAVTISFATLTGRRYTVESSVDLLDWTPLAVQSGTGALVSIPLNLPPDTPRVFYHVGVALE